MQALQRNNSLKSSASALSAALLKIARDGLAKEPMRLDALLSLFALGELAVSDESVKQTLEGESVWTGLFSEVASPLLSVDVAVKQSPEDAALIARFCRLLITKVQPRQTFNLFIICQFTKHDLKPSHRKQNQEILYSLQFNARERRTFK